MALYQKQNFTPPVLSRRWVASLFRPNMLIYCQDHIIAILKSGLLFREDSLAIEDEGLYWMDPNMGGPWLTMGERVVSAITLCASLAAIPPRNISLNRWGALRAASYLAVPMALRALHRQWCSGSIHGLVNAMSDYVTSARRAAACCREYSVLYPKLASVGAAADSLIAAMTQQQSDMVFLLSRVSSAVLGNAPWLRGDLAWDAVCQPGDTYMKIHHTFLVVQSLLLKHIAMVHYTMTSEQKRIYKNQNERIYWIHTEVVPYLIEAYRDNYAVVERMYRLLKNCATVDSDKESRRVGLAINNNWTYSEVHNGIARSCLELKIALNKSSSIDLFLDSCSYNDGEINLDALGSDIEELIDIITKSLSTAQSSQKRLKRIQGKVKPVEVNNAEDEVIEDVNIVKIEENVPQAKDEVFYFVKTEDDVAMPQAEDILTGPGDKEKEASKMVLKELKSKLGKREDEMRERERQALLKTMPEYKGSVPEFPKQIKFEDYVVRIGYVTKLLKKKPKRESLQQHTIGHEKPQPFKKARIRTQLIPLNLNPADLLAEAITKTDTKILTASKRNGTLFVIIWRRNGNEPVLESDGVSDVLSDVEAGAYENEAINRAVTPSQSTKENDTTNYRFSKKDLELSMSSDESDDDLQTDRSSLLDDVRRHRVAIRKKYPRKPNVDTEVDESLKPIEYSFGTGMAMASVLQVNSNAKIPTMAQEEVFIGDGEVSSDSGNSDID